MLYYENDDGYVDDVDFESLSLEEKTKMMRNMHIPNFSSDECDHSPRFTFSQKPHTFKPVATFNESCVLSREDKKYYGFIRTLTGYWRKYPFAYEFIKKNEYDQRRKPQGRKR